MTAEEQVVVGRERAKSVKLHFIVAKKGVTRFEPSRSMLPPVTPKGAMSTTASELCLIVSTTEV